MTPKRLNLLLPAVLLLSACSGGNRDAATAQAVPPLPSTASPTAPVPKKLNTLAHRQEPGKPFILPPSSFFLPSPPPPRPLVLVISWDGGRADTVYGLMDEGELPHFSAWPARGCVPNMPGCWIPP